MGVFCNYNGNVGASLFIAVVVVEVVVILAGVMVVLVAAVGL